MYVVIVVGLKLCPLSETYSCVKYIFNFMLVRQNNYGHDAWYYNLSKKLNSFIVGKFCIYCGVKYDISIP